MPLGGGVDVDVEEVPYDGVDCRQFEKIDPLTADEQDPLGSKAIIGFLPSFHLILVLRVPLRALVRRVHLLDDPARPKQY